MDLEAAYQKTLDYLYSFVDYSLQKNFRYSPEKFDLGRMRAFTSLLDNPELEYPIIHVAGTKGKGSVASLCASALQAAGYTVGLYTSPHLEDYVERIQIDGQPMPHADLVSIIDELKPKIESIPELTTFEITTGIAFRYFKRQNVSAAVLEVGLGGRLDATNVCLPKVCAITSLSYDHTALLGETLAEIAAEKGGIIKPGVPVVLAPQKDEARLVIERIARQQGAPLIELGRDYLFAAQFRSLDSQTLLVWPASRQPEVDAKIDSGGIAGWEPMQLTIPLLGQHQVENAVTAYAVLQVANQRGIVVSPAAVQEGFKHVSWPGRFEILRRDPPLIIDSAHNRDSALKLRIALDDYFPGSLVVLVFGASEDKDIPGMFSELLPRISQVVATKSEHPRAADPEKLADLARQLGRPSVVTQTIEHAMIEAERLAEGKAVILVTGSIFVAAAARSVWFERSTDKGVQ